MFAVFALVLYGLGSLAVGAVQFLICVAVPPLRRFALSAALWWAVWCPCMAGLMIFGTLTGKAVSEFARESRLGDGLQHLQRHGGWLYVAVAILVSTLAATVTAVLHQALANRTTFALFRIYATAVVAGIGSVFGWCLLVWLATTEMRFWAAIGLIAVAGLVCGFGWMAYRNARALRGVAPTRFTWIAPDEFDGTSKETGERLAMSRLKR